MSHYHPIDPKREGVPCAMLACMATFDGILWFGWNARERTADGATRSLGTEWIEPFAKNTRANFKRAEAVIGARNKYGIYVSA